MVRFIVLSMALFFGAEVFAGDPTYTAKTCKDEGRFSEKTWSLLHKVEPAIDEAWEISFKQTGRETQNCWVQWPELDGTPIDGRRTVIFDHLWVKNDKTLHHGYRVVYNLRNNVDARNSLNPKWVDQDGVERQILTFEVCRSVENCQKMGIPNMPTSPGRPAMDDNTFRGGPTS